MTGRYTAPRRRRLFADLPVVGTELVTSPEQHDARRECRCPHVIDARGVHEHRRRIHIHVLHDEHCPVLARVKATQS